MKPEDIMKLKAEAFIRTIGNIDINPGTIPYDLINASLDKCDDETAASSNIVDFQTRKSIIERRKDNNGRKKI